MTDLWMDALDLLQALGAWSGPALWLPVLIWTVLALPVSGALRLTEGHPSLRYRIQQALLAALPVGLIAGAWIDLPALSGLVGAWQSEPAAMGTVILSEATVTGAAETTAPAPWTWTWAHTLGLLTVGAACAALVQTTRLARSAAALIRLHVRLPDAAPGPAQRMADELAETLQLRRDVRVRCTPDAVVPMTYGLLRPTIVLPAALTERPDALRMTLTHELVHIRRFDFLARWAEQLVAAAAAIHPGVWWLTSAIERTREMACDAEALDRTRCSRKAYADLLYGFAAPARRPAFAVSIAETSSSLKERIHAMMSLDRSTTRLTRFTPWIAGALLITLSLGIVACSDSITPPEDAETSDEAQTAQTAEPPEELDGEVFVVVEDPPELIGGMEALLQEVQYPELAKKEGIEGRVFVQFVVDERGTPRNVKVTRGVHEALDAEAVRVVRQMEFKPGQQRGQAVNVKMSLPVTFKLSKDASSESSSMFDDAGMTKLPILINADGDVLVDGKPVEMSGVQSAVEAALARIDQKVVVSLKVDSQAPMGLVNDVQQQLRAAEANRIEYKGTPPPPSSSPSSKSSDAAGNAQTPPPPPVSASSATSSSWEASTEASGTDNSFQLVDVSASGGTLSGRVLHAPSGSPIAGANVTIPAVEAGAATGPDGRFVIHTNTDDASELVISHVNFERRTVSLPR